MIPILFEHDEKQFNTNGICRLVDCITCTVTEVLNGLYECEFKYPFSGRHFQDITEGRIIYTTHDDTHDPQPFDIYKKSAVINGIVTFSARHISYRLSNVIVEPFTAGSIGAVLVNLQTKNINENPFSFSTSVNGQSEYKLETPASIKSVLGGMEGSILDQYGGEYEWRKWIVYLRSKRGRDTSIELRYGKNITDIQYEIDSSNVYTAVVPYWKLDDGTLKMLPEKIIALDGSQENSKKAFALDLTEEFEVMPTDEELRAAAGQALAESVIPNRNITVNFFELWNTKEYEKYSQLQRVYLGDSVKVVYTDLGINTSLRVIKVVYNSLLEMYESMELGRLRASFGSMLQQSFREVIRQYAPSKTSMQQAIEHATELITGGTGGHFVIGTNANGQPNECFWLDTDNVLTAVHVLRINYQGIGFSSTGVEGPYTTAWTLDGHFVADFITTGNLNAALLTVGIIADALNKSSWDLESGLFITTLALIGGVHVGSDAIYSGNHNSVDSTATGFYLGSNGTFSIGDGNQYIKYKIYETTEGETVTQSYKLEMRLDSLVVGPTQKPITDTTFTQIDNDITDAARTATNYLHYSAGEGLVVSQTGEAQGSNEKPYNTQILDAGINFRKKDKILASLTGDFLTFFRALTGKKSMSLGATDLVFYKPDGTTEAAKVGTAGLNVLSGVIGGFEADSSELSSTYIDDPQGAATEYTVSIKKPASQYTKVIGITRKLASDTQPSDLFYIRNDGKIFCWGSIEFGLDQFIKINAASSSTPASSSMFIGSVASDSSGTRFTRLYATTSGNYARLVQLDQFSTYYQIYNDSSSSRRYKNHVCDMSLEYARKVLGIKPVLFQYKEGYLAENDECVGKEIPGFYAEDVEENFPMGVYHNSDGSVENWKPDRIIPAMLKVIQDQETEIANIKKEIAEIKSLLTNKGVL